MLSTRVIGTALVAIMLVPVPARADTLLIPFFGVNFGGDAGKEFSEAFDTSQYNWGVSIAFMGGGVFGVEGDFGFSPDFYGKTDVGGSNVLTSRATCSSGFPSAASRASASVVRRRRRGPAQIEVGLRYRRRRDRRERSDLERRRRRSAVHRDHAPVSVLTSATSRRSTIWRFSASRSASRPGRSISREARWVSC